MELIAEIGTAHAGSLDAARDLLDEVARAGFDCAKFQYIIAEEIVHPRVGTIVLHGRRISIYERFRALERPPDFYASLKEETEVRGLRFLCTPFGVTSADRLRELGVTRYKIASPELNHLDLLRYVSGTGLPVLASTGVSTLSDIELALDVLSREGVILLHCVTAYPAPEEEYNLSVVQNLSSVFGRPVGISDHTLDPELIPALGVAVGAVSLEKHVTVSREGEGLDDPIALPPAQMRTLVATVRDLRQTEATEQLEHIRERFGARRVASALGDGVKRPAPSEAGIYHRTRRSIHAVRNLPAGHRVTDQDVAALRTERELRPGMEPQTWESVRPARLSRSISAGEGVRLIDFLKQDQAPRAE